MYEIAVTGTDDEKIAAATILCEASLCRGWNIQEHTGLLITKLLSPAVPINLTGNESHLIGYAPFLNVLLLGMLSLDCIQIFSLHGLVPQLAAALMPICEVFGSSVPNMSWTLNTGEAISSHAIFSNAFVLLLKTWRFDQPPLDYVVGDGVPVGSHLNPDYLLSVYNSQLREKTNRLPRLSYPSSTGPVFMDSFPNLKRWYRKHQECISSILSSLVPENTVHQIVEALLSMMFRKINRGGQPLTSTTSGSSSAGSSSSAVSSEAAERLKIPAFDILEAVPFAIDAALSACAHGRLSPRELTTGLKDLADFLPASLVTIFSYYSAEVSRGLWKPVVMNGVDWPSSAGYLSTVEEQIKIILADTGVNVPYFPKGASSATTLPLPMAALLSLTITYKLNRVSESYLNLVGPAFENLTVRSPWPCTSVAAALWAQKAKHWNNFFVFIAAQAVFHHNNDAIVQLLRVCFTTALGLNSSLASNSGSVGALLGHGFVSQSAVAPGILYLRVHRAVRNVMWMTEEMVSILMQTVKDIANSGLPHEEMEKLKKKKYSTKYGQVSLAAAMNKVRIAASLGASLVWMAGGLNSIQYLFKEILPSWFIRSHGLDPNGQETGAMLGGYALAYFTQFCGLFAWGVDSTSSVPKRRRNVLGKHLEFIASALDGKISLGCNQATWRAYVTGYFSLMISCTPNWMLEVDIEVLKRICKGLKRWNEDEMAMALLGISGIGAMGVAAEMIIETGS